MVKEEVVQRDTLVLWSATAVPGCTATDFTIELPKPLCVKNLRLDYFTIPSTTFNAGSNVTDPFWIFEEQGFPEITNAKLPPFFYTGSNLPAALGAYLTSISPSGAVYTVTLVPGLAKLLITNDILTPFRFGGGPGTDLRNPFYFSIGYSEITGFISRPFVTSTVLPATIYLLPCPGGYYINVINDNQGFAGKSVAGGSNLNFSLFVPEGNVSTTLTTYSTNASFPQEIGNNINYYVNKIRVFITDVFGKPYICEGGATLIVFSYN